MPIIGNMSCWFSRQRGVAMTELLISLPALLLMGLGGWQTALLYDAKTTLNYATFEAARKGAVTHAQSDPMRQELGLRLAPLFGGDGSPRKAIAAITRASLDVQDPRFTEFEIINPTVEAFDDFGRDIVDPRNNETHFGIPNSHLRWRNQNVGRSGVNIQDANLLRIKTTYGYQLKVPLMDRVIPAVMRLIDPEHIHYYNARRLPITSVATVRMQSDAWRDDNNVHMESPGSGGTPPSTDDDAETGGTTLEDEAGQGGDDDDTDTSTDGDDQGTGDGDTGNDEGNTGDDTADGDDLPSIGDDQGIPPCDNSATEVDETASPTAQSSGLASSHTGNPIHVVTGNKYQQEVDLAPLPGALGLLFKRHYNSHNDKSGSLGHGWGHSYDLHLKAEPNSDGYRLHQSDGRVIHFQPTEQTDHYSAPRVSDGWLQVNEAQLTWYWRDGRQLQFSPQGKLKRIVLATGQTLKLFYNPQGKLFLVRDPQGRELTLDHYPNGRIKALYDPTGQATRYRYDAVGNLKQVTRADDSQRRYHYEDTHDKHNLTGITDERGIRYATWAYDDQDRAILSTHADQVGQVKLDFSTSGETKVTDSQGKLSTYSTEIRNGVALVTAIHGPGCSSCGKGDVSYRYNERLQLSEIATNDGITKRYRYDEQGRTTLATREVAGEAPQTLVRYAYENDSDLKPSAVIHPSINPQGERRLENRYNHQGQAIQITERGYRPEKDGSYTSIERTTRLDYSEAGHLTAIDGPRDDVEDILRLEYGDNHRITTIIGPDGSTLHIENYDDYGRPTQLKRGTQILIGIQYTPRGQIASVDQHKGKSVSYRYTETGKLKSLTGPDGKTYHLKYDSADRAIGITGLKGARTQNEIDTEGRLRKQLRLNSDSELIQIISYLYDAHGRLSAHQDLNGRQIQYRYDEDSRLNAIEGPNSIITELQYNGLDQLLSINQPDAGTTQLHYDSRGRASGVTDARSNRSRYLKDDFGRIVRIENPDSGTTQFIYDPAGNPIQKRDAQDNIIEYRYDAANRLIEKKSAEETTNLSYDQSTGQLMLIQTPNATERFKYNTNRKLIQHTRSINGKLFTTRYDYDPISRQLSSKQLPNGRVLNYHYYTEGEQSGQLRAITREGMFGLSQHTIIGEIDQDPSDGVSGLVHGNGIQSNHRYDANGRLTALENDQTLQLQYIYDEHGNISGIDLDNVLQHYRHDSQGRLTQADTALGVFRYQYDALGNRIRTDQTDPQGERSSDAYHYPPPGKGNRLSEKRSEKRNQEAIYQYNASGSPTQAGDLHYEYNTDQRPTKVFQQKNGRKRLIAEYGYNGFGERIKKVSYVKDLTPVVTYYLYDGSRLSAEINGNGEITAQYLYLGERPVAKFEGDNIYAIHTDHLSAPRAATDDHGRLVWQADYSPFGQIDIRTATIILNLRLPGQYEDQETGQYYNYLRTYNPETGRYLTADPIGLKAGLNHYTYVSSDPLHGIDPLGLFLLAFDGTWIDRNSTDPRMAITSNVELFRQYYEQANDPSSTQYIPGVGTGGVLDSVLGGGLAVGARDKIDLAVDMLKEYLLNSDDRSIDIVGFSRGAAMAREFANVILQKQANGEFDAPEYGQPFAIRFMGLFDSVSTSMADGSATNSCGFLYDYTISDRIGHVAQAYALNEHRPLFPQDSIDRQGGGGLSSNRVEQSFLGAHSDIGGGYNRNDQSVAQNGDLSDITLQWMRNQAEGAGVEMGELSTEHRTISNPTLHDSGGNFDREVRYPNDPDWHDQQQQDVLNPEEPDGAPPVYQRDDPLYQQLEAYIDHSTAQDGMLGTIDIGTYDNWLNQNRGVDVLH